MKANRVVLILGALAVCASLYAAGGSETKKASGSVENTGEKKIKLRLSSNVGKKEIDENKSAMAKGLNTWINTVQEASNGSISITLFTDAQLASNTEQIVNGIKTGGFEVSHFATGNWAEYTDAFAELNVPYLYSSFEEVHAVMDSDVGTAMMAKLEKDVEGIKALAYIDIGFRHVTNSKKTIKSPADMKGLKIRTMNDKFQIGAMEALGATVTPLSISELYGALQQHLVDAQENPLSTIYSQKFYEVNKYCTLTRHSYTSTFMFMNKKTYGALSDSQKKAIDAADKACMAASRTAAKETENRYADLLKQAGSEIYEPTSGEMGQFKTAAAKSWGSVKQLMGDVRYDKLLKVVQEAGKK
ncbi:MAG: TRAP transporter substrate-binding protein [Treponemataceae bacterium]